jgi:hypothetical protein
MSDNTLKHMSDNTLKKKEWQYTKKNDHYNSRKMSTTTQNSLQREYIINDQVRRIKRS